MLRLFGRHIHRSGNVCFSTKINPAAYESCLSRVQAVTNTKRLDQKVAKMAGLLLEFEDKAAADLKLQKVEDVAELKLQKANC